MICIVWKKDSSNASALPLSPAVIQTLLTFSFLCEDLKAIDFVLHPLKLITVDTGTEKWSKALSTF